MGTTHLGILLVRALGLVPCPSVRRKAFTRKPPIFVFLNLPSKQIADEPADVIEQVTRLDIPFSDDDHVEHQVTIELSS